MKILVGYPLDPELCRGRLGQLVVYRPGLARQPEGSLRETLQQESPDAAILGPRAPSPETLARWKEVRSRAHLVPVGKDRGAAAPDQDFGGVGVHPVEGEPGDLRTDLRALGVAERILARSAVARRLSSLGLSSQGTPEDLSGSKVTLVGAGIVNLITAWRLLETGASIEVLDAGPDPRTSPDWRALGATHGGDNARMFCFTEADNYNEKSSVVYREMDVILHRTIADGGWLAVPDKALSRKERAWIRNFDRLPAWIAEVFTEDIHRFNRDSHELWNQIRHELPEVFEGANFTRGVLRIYTQLKKLKAAERLHRRIGSLQSALGAEELRRRHPAFAPAVEEGEVVGGLEVRGFTVNIHQFVVGLLSHLEGRGVSLHWNEKVLETERDGGGRVSGLRTEGGTVRSDHYVLSPGASGGSLLRGARSADKVMGVLGVWLRLPHLEPRLDRSVKIHREGHVGEDSNVTLATDGPEEGSLILGSGYGFIGNQPLDMGSPEIASLFEAAEENARRFLPLPYAEACRRRTLYGARKACVRPFTSTGLGIFEVEGTSRGGRMVITTGHNTGGFAQSPAVAQAVSDTLRGVSHPMQTLYEPTRGLDA